MDRGGAKLRFFDRFIGITASIIRTLRVVMSTPGTTLCAQDNVSAISDRTRGEYGGRVPLCL